MEKVNSSEISITRYRHADFYIDIVEDKNRLVREAWLLHKDYAVSNLMFGCSTTDTTPDEFLELVENQLSDYIPAYVFEYCPELLRDDEWHEMYDEYLD